MGTNGGRTTLPKGRAGANPAVGPRGRYVRPIAARDLLQTLRERSPLPPGAGPMGVALGIAGASSYGFLVVSARALGKDGYAPLSVLWALTLLTGPGLFLAVEQEVARALAERRSRGEGGRPVVAHAARLALGLLGVLLVLGVALRSVLLDRLLSGHGILLVALLASLAAACAAHLARGVLSGVGRFDGYARIIGGESLVRFVAALGLVAVGVDTVGPYGLAVAAGPMVAVAVALRGQRGLLEDGPPAAWSEVTTALAWLLLGSVLSVGLVNAGPLAIELLASEVEEAEAGRFLAGLVMARVPLFLFQAVQVSVLPRLSALAGEGRTVELRQGLGRLLLLVSGVALVGVAGAAVVGPQVVRLLFGAEFELSHRTMGLLALGSGAFMVASLLSQAAIALGGHRNMALGWLVGMAALVLATAVSSDDLFLRVELGGAAGCLAALAAQGLVVRDRLRHGATVEPGDLIEALHEPALEP